MFEHVSVLRDEAVKGLAIKPDGVYVDCTVGGGGHAAEILSQLNESGLLIAFDQDLDALKAAKKRLHNHLDQTIFINRNFRYLSEELQRHKIDHVDGILFDLGVSSPQLDRGDRGFSYQHEAQLDMRMDQGQSLTAHEVVNTWSYERLVSIFFKYGEEKFSRQIARRIESYREDNKIDTTHDLVEIIKDAIPAPARRSGGHPARKIFQAIRIAVNDELLAFQDSLHQAAEVISVKGRIAVITFHSLEDRLCTQAFRKWSTVDLPPKLPIIPEGHEAPFKLITRRPIVASTDEVDENRRSRSARLRIVEKEYVWDKKFTYEEGWKL